jgi:hypothetical protein
MLCGCTPSPQVRTRIAGMIDGGNNEAGISEDFIGVVMAG